MISTDLAERHFLLLPHSHWRLRHFLVHTGLFLCFCQFIHQTNNDMDYSRCMYVVHMLCVCVCVCVCMHACIIYYSYTWGTTVYSHIQWLHYTNLTLKKSLGGCKAQPMMVTHPCSDNAWASLTFDFKSGCPCSTSQTLHQFSAAPFGHCKM